MKATRPTISRRRVDRAQGVRRRRGFSSKSFNQQAFDEATGTHQFVQDNHSRFGRWVGAELSEDNQHQL